MAKIGRVSFTRMRSILDNNKIPLTDSQFTLLCKNFSYEGIEFNYVDFIEALKQYEGNDEWSYIEYKIKKRKLFTYSLFPSLSGPTIFYQYRFSEIT